MKTYHSDELGKVTVPDEETALDVLNEIRDRILKLPTYDTLRVRYRDIRRGLANASEEVRAGVYEHGFIDDNAPLTLARRLREALNAREEN